MSALKHNYSIISNAAMPANVCAVVKANAYGHGGPQCAAALQSEGATWFAVTDCSEALALRQAGITGRILLLAGFWKGEEEVIVKNDFTPVVWDTAQIKLLEHAAKKLDRTSFGIHLKVDTGMARLGVQLDELPGIVRALHASHSVFLDGLLSHLSSAEVYDGPRLDEQLLRFETALAIVTEFGLMPQHIHICNSAGIISRPAACSTMVRPGISLYGYFLPFMSTVTGTVDAARELPVLPVLSWKTRIIALRDLEARTPVGYGGGYITQKPSRMAVLAVGYGDGLCRRLSNRGRVIVRDEFAPIVGNVTMDMTTIDVTAIPEAALGDEVILIGHSSDERQITAWDHAALAQTIPYEVLCNINARVPRVYVE